MSLDAASLARLDEALSFLGERLVHDRPLGPLSTYRVGGPARRFVEVGNADELVRIATAVAATIGAEPGATNGSLLVVGRGSNLLVADRGVDALVVQLGEGFAGIEVDRTVVRAGGATSLPVLARRTVAAGLTGFEWAVGVPGSVGGAVRMNAGGHGADMAAALLGVRVVDLCTGEDVHMDLDALDLGYRRSSLSSSAVVVHADLQLAPGDVGAGEATLSQIVRWRREHQPGGQNAGSVFTNPPGASAGQLIDAAGARGLRIGTAEVSVKHANFIQADPGGSADDVAAVDGRGASHRRGAQRRGPAPRDRHGGIRRVRFGGVVVTTTERPRVVRSQVEPRLVDRRRRVREAQRRRRRNRLVAIGAAVAVVAAAVGAAWSPLTDVDTIDVVGTDALTADQIRTASGIDKGDQMVAVDLSAVRTRLRAEPMVAAASVTREWPATVRIELAEETPLLRVRAGEVEHIVSRTGSVLPDDLDVAGALPRLDVTEALPADIDWEAAGEVPEALTGVLVVHARMPDALRVPLSDGRLDRDGDLSFRLDEQATVRFGPVEDVPAKLVAVRAFLEQVTLECLDVLDVRQPGRPTASRRADCVVPPPTEVSGTASGATAASPDETDASASPDTTDTTEASDESGVGTP